MSHRSGKRANYQTRTDAQARYQEAIRNHDVTFAIGPAGVGKSHVAAMEAALALEEGEVSRIILIRPAREAAGERLGYLPGTAQEKIEPYMFPIMDSWSDVWQPQKVKSMMERDIIQTWPVAHLRGRTFRNAFVIVDEVQNLTRAQLYLVLTRFGEGSRMVLDGDFAQSDLMRTEEPCDKLVRALEGSENVAHIHFSENDVVRHRVVRTVILANATLGSTDHPTRTCI